MPNIQADAYERLCWEPGFIPFRFNCGRLKGSKHSMAVTWGCDRDNAGVTDLAVFVYGRQMVWIEVKQPGEKHLPSQIKFRAEIQAQGGKIWTITTLNELEDVIVQIRKIVQKAGAGNG